MLLLMLLSINLYSQQKPNIIFILVDDQSYLSAGFNGNDVIKTPNLDKLADNGIVLDNYYNSTAICMASRAIIMTGMNEYKTATNFQHGSLSAEKFSKSYPVLLRESGYEVSFAGKFGYPVTEETTTSSAHHEWDLMPVDQFDVWKGGFGQTSYHTEQNEYIKEYAAKYPHSRRAYGAWASDYLKSKEGNNDKPFCMSISFKAPHNPPNPDPEFDSVYEGVTFPYPENYGRENAEHLPIQARSGRQYMSLFDRYGCNTDKYQETVRRYYQLLYGVDYAVGGILETLKETGLDKNTIIIYTSDNGYFLGAHGFGGKVLPYEEGAKAPFIFFDPRNENMGKQIRSNSLIGSIDIAPTILALAGLEAPDNMDGISFLPVMEDSKKEIREFLPVVNFWGTTPTQALSIQTERYKYIYWPYEGDDMKSAEELYDKENDSYEKVNLVGKSKYKKVLAEMRTYYDEQVAIIKRDGVDYNKYDWYKTYLDRHVTWADKEAAIQESKRKHKEAKAKKSKKEKGHNKKDKSKNKKDKNKKDKNKK